MHRNLREWKVLSMEQQGALVRKNCADLKYSSLDEDDREDVISRAIGF